MSDTCLMAPKGDTYSQVSDDLFDAWAASQLISESSIDVVAFWKYNVKVLSYEETYTVSGVVTPIESFVAAATTTLKSGFALYLTTSTTGLDSFEEPVLEPARNSANYYEPNLFYFNATDFFTHRGKWYIHDPFGTPDGTITADLSSLVVEYGPPSGRTKLVYTSLETFY